MNHSAYRMGVRFSVRLLGLALLGLFLLPLAGANTGPRYVPSLWVITRHALVRLSATDGAKLKRLNFSWHLKPEAVAESVIDGEVWVLFRRSLRAWSAQGTLLVEVSLSRSRHHGDDNSEGHGQATLAVDTKGGVLWLSRGRRLYRYNLQGKLQAHLKFHRHIRAITLDTAHSVLWVAAGRTIKAYNATGEKIYGITLGGWSRVKALAWSNKLSGLWVLRGRWLSRYSADGTRVLDFRLPRRLDWKITSDGSGALWVTGGGRMARIDSSGLIEFVLRPFAWEDDDDQVALVANLGDHSAWVATRHRLAHVSATGVVLKTIDLNHGDEGEHKHRDLGSVRALTLWADTAPPALSFIAPAEAAYIATTMPPLIFHYSDHGSGVDLSSLALAANGQSLGVSCPPPPGTVPSAGTASCALAAPLSQGGQFLSATVDDFAGNTSRPATRSFTVDTIPPTITLTQPSGRYTNQPHLLLQGHLSEAGTLIINRISVAVQPDLSFSESLNLAEGTNLLSLTATDLAGNITKEPLTIILDTVPPPLPNLGLISISGPDQQGQVTVTGKAGAVEGGDAVTITDTRTGASVTVTANADGSFTAKIAAEPGDKLAIKVTDEAGNVTTSPNPIDVSNLPPDPSRIAPPLSQTGTTPFIDKVSFLYSGSNPIQTGVASGAIVARRVAVIRGQVINRGGNPLPGVTVSVEGHPELGKTLSRADGRYDLVVNGGGQVVLSFSKKDYLPAWRSVQTSWKDYSIASKVALIKEDTVVTAVSFGTSAPAAVATGSEETGAAGGRRARIYFPAGTTAEMVMPDGSTQLITSGAVRATEYTVGPNGPAAMPANLPPTSAYTYAVDLTVDQAQAAGASTVQFNQPVPVYVDNYLGFPIGTHVPAAWYNAKKAEWIPIDDGRVIKLLNVNAQGEADLDVDGTGAPAATTTIAAMGITSAERTELATLYKPGDTFWRVPVTHFTAYDFNWLGVGDEVYGVNANTNVPPKKPCPVKGCIITAQTQVVAEQVLVTGTPFSLYYSSGRQPGYKGRRTANITLSGSVLPPHLEAIDLEVDVAGQVFKKSFMPKTDLTYEYTWNGLDAYGRKVPGAVPAMVKITYVTPIQYVAIHNQSQSFGVSAGSNTKIIATRNDQVERVTKSISLVLSGHSVATSSGALGGWNLSVHDSYDPETRTVYEGTGGTEKNICVGGCLNLFAGGGDFLYSGKTALQSRFYPIYELAQDAKGNIYVGTEKEVIRRIGSNGIVDTVVGGGSTPPADGVVATKALITISPDREGLSVGPYGGLYFLQVSNTTSQLFRVDSGGILHAVANIPCITVGLSVAHDGSAYVACFGNHFGNPNILYKVSPGGGVHAIAKERVEYGEVFGEAISLCQNQDIYYYSENDYQIRELSSTGGATSYPYDGGFIGSMSCDENNGLYIGQGEYFDAPTSYGNGVLYRKLDGTLIRLTKPSYAEYHFKIKNGTLLYQNYFYRPTVMYSHLYHGLFIAEGGKLWLVHSYASTKASSTTPDTPVQVASRDGTLVNEFSPTGLHTKTIDAITGNTVYSFGYNSSGQLTTITDANGNVTRIVRDSNEAPTEIIAPTGQITSFSVDSNGYLSTISNAGGGSYQMSYTHSGLIKSFTDPDARTETYSYDVSGRLLHNLTAAGGGWRINKTQSGSRYTVTMQSAMGRQTTYQVTNSGKSTEQQVVTAPNGTSTATVNYRSGLEKTTVANGAIIKSRVFPDPRFYMQAPMPSVTVSTPAGLELQASIVRAATLASASNPLSLTGFTQKTTVNGQAYTSHYDAASHQWTMTSPVGRAVIAVVDDQDRPLTVKAPSLATVAYAYDAQGYLVSVTAGSGDEVRMAGFDYYANGPAKGWLKSVTDAMNRTTGYAYDAAGRVTGETLPDGEVIGFGYDAVGNLTRVTPPSRPAHGMSYTAADQLAGYTPPATTTTSGTGAAVQYSYNLDRQLTGIALPSGKDVTLQYNSGGQLTTMVVPSGQYQYGYDATTGQLTSLIAGADGESLGFAYDGFLPTQAAWSGPVSGTIAVTYDNNFRVTGLAVDGTTVAYGYDADSLLTQAGDLRVSRSAANGLITGTILGDIATNRSYDHFGEETTFAAAAGSSTLYAATYTYNQAGKITAKTEQTNDAGQSWAYGYDDNGRLVSVTQGATTTTYGYDANGNRISVNGSTVATYNARDQLLTYGQNSYTWTADGGLETKITPTGTTHYTWNALGELTDVILPDGTTTHYVYDGLGHRVGKEKNGTLVAGYLYTGSRLVAETDGQGTVTERFVYATKANVPAYFIKYNADGTNGLYRIVSDQVGSVREVIDALTGAVVQRIDYGTWGKITVDTDPGFQPFGFAGGLYDAATGLEHFGARDYDPGTARWISRDPILFAGGDANLYRYVVDDPVNGMDPTGENAAIQDLNDAREGQGLPPIKPPTLPKNWHLTLSAGAQGLVATLGIGGYAGLGFDNHGHICFFASAVALAGVGLFGEAGLKADIGATTLCTGVTKSVGPFGFYMEGGGSMQFEGGQISGETGVFGPGAGYAGGVAGTQTAMFCFHI